MSQSSKPSQHSPYKSTVHQPYEKKIKKKGRGPRPKEKTEIAVF